MTVFAAALTAVAGLTLAGAPGAAAADRASFNLTVGATYFKGTIEFYNRSVTVNGVLRGLSTGCRRGAAWAFASSGSTLDNRSTTAVCNGAVSKTIPLTADVPGGAAEVEVDLLEGNGYRIASCRVQRGFEYCE
ncbi:hypothetical protein [Streptomyces chartreusis]|uniref:hypothetical protein n=1 Tax=Streptomyces chartreusis TaxID=1969 RepID=UPI0036470528